MNAEWHVLGRGECRRYVVDRGDAGYVSIVQVQYAELCTAEPGCIRQHGLEHSLQLAGRSADDLEDLRGRGLLLQRLGEVLACLGELAVTRFELLFQLGQGGSPRAGACSPRRSGRTNTAWPLAFCFLARQDHPPRRDQSSARP
jgi:hypothetical protein